MLAKIEQLLQEVKGLTRRIQKNWKRYESNT